MTEVYIKLALSLLVSIWVLRLTNKIAPRFYSLRFITGYYTFQFAALLAFLIVLPGSRVWNTQFPNLYMRDYIDEGIAAYFIFQIGVLLSALMGVLLFGKMRKRKPLTDYIKEHRRVLIAPLVFGALVILTHPFLVGFPGIGYASSILFNFLTFIPFAAGVLYFHNKGLRFIWLLALIVLFVVGILTGGRGTAITAAVLYAIGYYYALTTVRAKRAAIVAGIALSIPLMSFLAFVGIFRHIVGRVGLEKITWERAVQVYETYEKVKDSKALNLSSAEGKLQGWGRFVNFVNFTQFATIPSIRPHLGDEGLFTTDVYYSFDVAFISGTTTEERLRAKFSNFKLNDYGYSVTLGNSVEYSLVTEGYIRFGFVGIFVFAIAMGLFSQFMEFMVYLSSSKYPAIQVFAIVIICQQALFGYAYNLFVIMRNMVVGVAAAVAIIALIRFFQIFLKALRKRSSTAQTESV